MVVYIEIDHSAMEAALSARGNKALLTAPGGVIGIWHRAESLSVVEARNTCIEPEGLAKSQWHPGS